MRKNNFVFLKADGQAINPLHIYHDFGKAQARAKMDKRIRFHDLRHTFASHFMMSGGNLYDLQKILGHTQFEMTQIYAHLSPDHLANKTQILSFGSEVLDSLSRVPLID
ncbi:MAG: tyrosine-type recombinase/integrase [Bdellovibrio sp.]|nr:tyrosine-type recombinase/integrase [Bdellovibrio sp.]